MNAYEVFIGGANKIVISETPGDVASLYPELESLRLLGHAEVLRLNTERQRYLEYMSACANLIGEPLDLIIGPTKSRRISKARQAMIVCISEAFSELSQSDISVLFKRDKAYICTVINSTDRDEVVVDLIDIIKGNKP